MKNKALTTFVAALMTLSLAAQSSGTFTTHAGELIDAEGNTFVIRGINNAHIWFGQKAYEALDAIESIGANTVRIVWNTKGEDAELERIIRRCIDLKMVPMVELHDVTGSKSGERLVDMAKWYAEPARVAMLRKYERYLLLNIANEWGSHEVKTLLWLSSYSTAVRMMREAGYATTLVVDAPGWGQNITPILEAGQSLVDADPAHNILFSIHMYGSWNRAGRVERKLAKCHRMQLPIIVGEFGYNHAHGKNNLGCKVDHTAILSTCNALGLGYMPWSWTGNNQENQWLDLVSPLDWTTLTWWGEQVISGPGGITETSRRAGIFE